MNTIKVKNIAELKLRKGTPESTVEVLGYYLEGDGGGGNFYWDNTSTETDNGGTIISVSTIGTGRWKRIVNEASLNVKWFGAKGDKTTNDTPFIQKAIDESKNFNGCIYLSEGNYYLDTAINPYSGLRIEGESYKGIKSPSDLYYPRVSLTGNNRLGFLIAPVVADEYNSDAWIASLYISGVTFQYCEYYIGNADYTKYLVSVTLENCNFLASTRVSLKGNFILTKVIDCDFGYYGDITYPSDMKHIEFIGSGALTSNNNNFTGCRFYNSTSTEAFVFQEGLNTTFINCNIEGNNNSTRCIKLVNYNQISFIGCWIEYNKGVAIVQGDEFSKHINFLATTFVTGKSNQFIAITYTESIASFSFNNCYFYSLGKFTDIGATVLTECRLTFDGVNVDGGIKSFSNNVINQDTFIWDGVTEKGTYVSSTNYPYEVKDMYKGRREVYRTTAPTTGTWSVGDITYNTAPASAGYVGWICTVAGTPGTWNTFGLIS